MLEQDYVALSEMPSNDEASLMYDLPTASATTSVDAGAGGAVPEPTKVGAGMVLLGAASKWMDGNGDGEGEQEKKKKKKIKRGGRTKGRCTSVLPRTAKKAICKPM